MTRQRILAGRTVFSSTTGALSLAAWLLATAAVGQEATPGAASAPAKAARPSQTPSSKQAGMLMVYRLKCAEASSIAKALADLMKGKDLHASFVVEQRLNAVIVQASPEVHAEVEELIETLDIPGAPDGTPELKVFRLRYVDPEGAARVASAVCAGQEAVRIAVDGGNHAIVVHAPSNRMQEIGALLAELDVPPKGDPAREIKIFALKHAHAGEAVQVIREVLTDARVAVDSRTNAVLVEAPSDIIHRAETILARLDTQSAEVPVEGPPGAMFRVRVVWLASGLSADDAAVPPADLKDVVNELSQIGVNNLRQVGQVIVNATPDGRFEVHSLPLLDKVPSDLTLSGEFESRQDIPKLRINLKASQTTMMPPPAAEGIVKDLVNVETVIIAPVGHSVVLGVAPMEAMTSVFVVQVTVRGQ